MAKSVVGVPVVPATTILPSFWRATAFPLSLKPTLVTTFPSESKLTSSDPSTLYRTNSISPKPSPTTTIFPLL